MLLNRGTEARFVGPFKDLLTNFVAMKCSIGFNYASPASILERFSKFTVRMGIEEPILTKDLALAWIKRRENECDRNWEARINNLKQFAVYLVKLGYPAYVPYCKAKIDRHQVEPHIFTENELKSFFHACDNRPARRLANRNIVFPVLFRLIYGCGLRISEALSLRLCDIDLVLGIITIRGGKNGKNRLLPMSKSVTASLSKLHSSIHGVSNPQDNFFVKRDRTRYNRSTVYQWFREVLWQCKISHGGKGHGPRVHDFRHTFAVHSLRNLVKQGLDVYCVLPILSTYLGHASITATERYVRLTSELFPCIIESTNPVALHVFQEVFHETD